MRYRNAAAAALAAGVCFLAHAGGPESPRPQSAVSEPTALFSYEAQTLAAISDVLQRHPEVKRAYLVPHPDTGQPVLIPIFDKAPVQAALDDAMAAYAKTAPNGPPLEIALLAKRAWKRDTAGMTPFYVRP